MKISINDKRFKATLEDEKKCRRKYGAEMTRKIIARIAALNAAESLADLSPPMSGPERCHELKGDLDGVFSIDLKHPNRLLFMPIDAPTKEDCPNESERWKAIRAIEILEIRDTHE